MSAIHNGITSGQAAPLGASRKEAQKEPSVWGRVVETAVGSYLLRACRDEGFELYYWRDGDSEVDFVARRGSRTTAIEVKSGRSRRPAGMEEFYAAHKPNRSILVGSGGIELSEFFAKPASHWLA